VGGQTTPIWIVDLKTLDLVKCRATTRMTRTVWVGHTVYFLSDRDGHVSLYSYDVESKQVSAVVHNTGYDLKTFQAGPGIGLRAVRSIHLVDTSSNADKTVPIQIHGDWRLWPRIWPVRPDPSGMLRFAHRSKRLRGRCEIFTYPGKGRYA